MKQLDERSAKCDLEIAYCQKKLKDMDEHPEKWTGKYVSMQDDKEYFERKLTLYTIEKEAIEQFRIEMTTKPKPKKFIHLTDSSERAWILDNHLRDFRKSIFTNIKQLDKLSAETEEWLDHYERELKDMVDNNWTNYTGIPMDVQKKGFERDLEHFTIKRQAIEQFRMEKSEMTTLDERERMMEKEKKMMQKERQMMENVYKEYLKIRKIYNQNKNELKVKREYRKIRKRCIGKKNELKVKIESFHHLNTLFLEAIIEKYRLRDTITTLEMCDAELKVHNHNLKFYPDNQYLKRKIPALEHLRIELVARERGDAAGPRRRPFW